MSNSPPSEKDIGRLYKNYNYFLDWGPIVHYRTVKWNGDKWAFHDVLCISSTKSTSFLLVECIPYAVEDENLAGAYRPVQSSRALIFLYDDKLITLTPSEYSSVLLYPITSLTKKRRS
jgi:hypothetical protein